MTKEPESKQKIFFYKIMTKMKNTRNNNIIISTIFFFL